MASFIETTMFVGSTAADTEQLPYVVDDATPYFEWTLPEGVVQRRFNIKLECREPDSDALFILGETVSSENTWQWPTGLGMSDNWRGLIHVELAISEDPTPGQPFEYSTGTDTHYYVYDPLREQFFNNEALLFQWNNSFDINTTQELQYHLQVCESPLFNVAMAIDEYVSESAIQDFTRSLQSLPVDHTYFWRVRGYDGYDHSAWSKTNGFLSFLNNAPTIEILSVTPFNNEFGDVLITYTSEDLDLTSICVYGEYTGGDTGAIKSQMYLINPNVWVPNGEHSVIWRSGRTEKQVYSTDYTIYLKGYDNLAYSQEEMYGPFTLDNSTVGAPGGGLGAVDTEFAISGNIFNIPDRDDYDTIVCPVSAHLSELRQYLQEHISPVIAPHIKNWKIYTQGSLFPGRNNLDRPGNDWGVAIDQRNYFSHYGLYWPFGVAGYGSTSNVGYAYFWGFPSHDYRIGDDAPIITRHVDIYGSNGWPVRIRDEEWTKNGMREGYIRTFQIKWIDKELCDTCGGTGWQVELQSGKYVRIPCSECGGTGLDASSPTSLKTLAYPVYIPIEEIVGNTDAEYAFFSLSTEGFLKRNQYILGATEFARRDHDPWTVTAEENIDATIRDIDWLTITGGVGNLIQSDAPPDEFPISSNVAPAKETLIEETILNGEIAQQKEDYFSGYDPNIGPAFGQRPLPPYLGDRGFAISGDIAEEYPLEPLRIVFLQGAWDAYNTVHWEATLGPSTKIHLQYSRYFNETEHTDYVDAITEFSEFDTLTQAWLVKPLVWHTYWNTVSDNMFQSGYDYRLRIRMYDEVSHSFSEWVYSRKFEISHTATNPANVTDVTYEPWRKTVAITFRMDDTQNDLYNITAVWYSSDDRTWHQISPAHLLGDLTRLSSDPNEIREDGTPMNVHTIRWRSSSYNLEQGETYRIKIETVPTAIVDGLTLPHFTWAKSHNPIIQKTEEEVARYIGSVQDTVWDEESQQWTDPGGRQVVPGEIQLLRLEVADIEAEPSPSGKAAFFNPSGVLIDASGYASWLNTEIRPGYSRGVLLSEKQQRIYELEYEIVPALYEQKDNAERQIRKDLIDQGYYNNGYVDNDPNKEAFRFRVEFAPITYDIENYTHSSLYEVYDRFQLDFYSSFDSQYDGKPLRDIFFGADGERIAHAGIRQYTMMDNTDPDSDYYYQTTDTYANAVDADPNASGIWSGEDQADQTIDHPYKEDDDSQFDNPHYVKYTLPKSDLPGQWVNKYVNSTFPEWTDHLPAGVTSFETNYRWRVASYNAFIDDRNEEPRTLITDLSLEPYNDRIKLTYVAYADESVNYISHDYDPAHSVFPDRTRNYYISVANKTPEWVSEQDVEFPTDYPTDASGVIINPQNVALYTPPGSDRSRPWVVTTADQQFYMWYTKDNIYDESTIMHARGKNHSKFGEYSQLFPANIKTQIANYDDLNGYYGQTVAIHDGLFKMWVTGFSAQNKIMYSSSTDGDLWSKPTSTTGLDNYYYPSVIIDGPTYKMWMCKHDGSYSKVFYATSINGIDWTVQNSGNAVHSDTYDLNSPCVIKLGENSYKMYFTKYLTASNTKIYSVTSSDGITWSNETVEVDEDHTANPCVIIDRYMGNNIYRIFYNQYNTSQEEPRVKTKRLEERTWTLGAFNQLSGEWKDIQPSKSGREYTIYISMSANGITETDDVGIRLNFKLNDTDKEYRRQSSWITMDNYEDYRADMNPLLFKYNDFLLNTDYAEEQL